MRIVLTGATGFIGRALGSALAASGDTVHVLARDPRRVRADLAFAAHVHTWDAMHGLPPAEALKGAEAVIHLAGDPIGDGRWTAAKKRAIADSRIQGTRNLVEAMAHLPSGDRPRTLVSSSAIGFYGDRGDECLTEESAHGDGFLAEVCAKWETEAMRAAALGLRVAIVRTGMVLGSGGALTKLVPLFRRGLGGPVGSGGQYMSAIHRDDLVRLCAFLVKHPETSGIYNGVLPEPATNREFSTELARALGRPAWLPAPALAVRLALGEMATLVLGSQRVMPARALAAGFRFQYPSLKLAIEAAIREF